MSTSPPLPLPFLPTIYTNLCSDYCVVAFGIVLIISLLQWFIDGRKNFTGPRVDIDELSHGVTVGQAPLEQEDSSEDAREKKSAMN